MPNVAPTALAVQHSRIRDIADIAMSMAASGTDEVYKLYFGESTMPTPSFIQRAAQKAMADGYTRYTENAGIPSLRRTIARHFEDKHKVQIDPETEIIVTGSGVQALNLGIRCCVDPGDEVIVVTPGWQNQLSIPHFHNAVSKQVALKREGSRMSVDFDALEAAVTPRTRLVVYTSPSNPVGWTATVDEQRALLDFCRKHDIWLLADEVYERLWYPEDQPLGTPAPSIMRIATRDDAVFSVQSVSKTYCMTGWRIGWIVGRKDFIRRATYLNEFVVSSAAGFSQRASEEALLWGEQALREMLALYKSNRDYCLAILSKLKGVSVPDAPGAFYLFPYLDGLDDSFEFCKRLLMEERVGLAPGVAFGTAGEGAVRICYAVDRTVLEAAMQRFAAYVGAGLHLRHSVR